jgi:hypothetical protein
MLLRVVRYSLKSGRPGAVRPHDTARSMTLAKADTSTFKCRWAAVFLDENHFLSKLHQGW